MFLKVDRHGFPVSIVRHVQASETAAWRNRAAWRVKAQIAIGILEAVLENPKSALEPCEGLYSAEFRCALLSACRDEIERLRRALDDNRLLATIYGRNIPKVKGGMR